MRNALFAAALFCAILSSGFYFASRLGAQSGGARKPLTQEQFRREFWRYLTVSSPYKNWKPFPGVGAAIKESAEPKHGKFVRLFANTRAAAAPKTLPHGSIIVKENYDGDKKTLLGVTVMYRVKGYDKEHFDWYWIKYRPDGAVDLTPPAKGKKPIAGRFPGCIACHGGANGDDFTFANDE